MRALFAGLLLLAAPCVRAETLISLAGRVSDRSGAALPGVTVEARGASVRLGSTGSSGEYRLDGLEPGSYEISFRLPGFVALTRRAAALEPGETRRLDAVLQLSVTADVVVSGKKTFTSVADFADAGASLVGIANASSEGTVSGVQIDERPTFRSGEVLETVPGMVISQHSGEGKANQYYLRGFNLDHGTDFATSVAGIPVNLPSHAHGQGYSDLNFVIPELVSGVQYRKGVYAAEQGDFSTAGSASIRYVTSLERPVAKVDGGTQGYGRALAAESLALGPGTLLWAVEAGRDDGPWVHPDQVRRYNGVVRYSRQQDEDAFSVTAMAYGNRWNSTDQVPDRAVASGLIPRFGAIDPTDGGESSRRSLSADWQRSGDAMATRVTVYAVGYDLKLFSNFTYFLDDPIRGDQFEQVDRRVVTGLSASRSRLSSWFGREVQTTVGIQARNDNIAEDGLFHTEARQRLGSVRDDHVVQTSASIYAESSIRWSPKVRTVLGLRADSYRFRVASVNSGSDRESLVSPKLSLALGPWEDTEFYVNAGYGFHSNDARGATISVDPKTGEPVERVTPLVRARGAEVGLRSVLVPHLQATVALWELDIGSELVFTGDAGTTEPSRPSRRTGIELANVWTPRPGLVFDADLAVSRARFRDSEPVGDRIPGAVEAVVSAGASIENLSGFFGSLRLRYFGPRPLIENDTVRSRSSAVVYARIGREIAPGVRLAAEIFNLADARVSDIDYYYVSRLPGEPAAGVADVHSHPAVPRTVRASLSCAF